MNINNMREYIKNAYPGPNWRKRCDNMPANQVIAVYKSIRSRRTKRPPIILDEAVKPEGRQLTIWELL